MLQNWPVQAQRWWIPVEAGTSDHTDSFPPGSRPPDHSYMSEWKMWLEQWAKQELQELNRITQSFMIIYPLHILHCWQSWCQSGHCHRWVRWAEDWRMIRAERTGSSWFRDSRWRAQVARCPAQPAVAAGCPQSAAGRVLIGNKILHKALRWLEILTCVIRSAAHIAGLRHSICILAGIRLNWSKAPGTHT